MNRHLPVIIERDKDGVFIVECPILRGCRSYGYTVDEAVENIREAIAACLDEEQSVPLETRLVGVRDLEVALPGPIFRQFFSTPSSEGLDIPLNQNAHERNLMPCHSL